MNFLLTGDLNPVIGAPAGAAPAVGEVVVPAYPHAQPQPQDDGGGGFTMWMIYGIWALVIVGFYFLTIRPQRKRAKQMEEMQAGLKVGDNVLTNGGMFGRIAEVGEDCFVVEFGTNRGVRIPIRKGDVLGVQSPQLTKSIGAKEDES